MIKRREFLRETSLGIAALGAGALITGLGADSAFAKRSPSKKKRKRPATKSSAAVGSEALSQVLTPIRDQHHLPGLIGAIVHGSEIRTIAAVGIRKIGAPEQITVGDQVHLGSNTKAMTATMIATLVDEGKLGWGSTIGEIFADHTSIHADFRAVTLWQLLTHRAGLPHDVPWWRLGRGRSTTDQRREILSRTLTTAPATKPGSRYEYSNVGYALAGLMAEQVTSQSWEKQMRERLFQPLEMASAGFGPPGTPGKVDEPWGHREKTEQLQPVQGDNAPALGPAGTVHCTMADWAKFAGLHTRGARGKPRLLKEATFRKLHTPDPGSGYAGGWMVTERSWAGGTALMHSGSNTMWYATIWLAPMRNFALLVATNAGGDGATVACDEAIGELIKLQLS